MRHTMTGQQLQPGWYWDSSIDDGAKIKSVTAKYPNGQNAIMNPSHNGSTGSGPQKCWTDACMGGNSYTVLTTHCTHYTLYSLHTVLTTHCTHYTMYSLHTVLATHHTIHSLHTLTTYSL
jgi:hypothetical protein